MVYCACYYGDNWDKCMYFYCLLPLHATLILMLFISVIRYIDEPVIYSTYLLDTCTVTYMTIVLNIERGLPVFFVACSC